LAHRTISGTSEDAFGSLLELSWNGTKPVPGLKGPGFLQDGDKVRMFGHTKNGGVGFGDCTGVIAPPHQALLGKM
jgi:fumarylacetoacetase